jgi:cytochrome c peroxidase
VSTPLDAIAKSRTITDLDKRYAKDNEKFFKDFSNVILKLFELGVPFAETTDQARMTFKPTHQ